MKIWEKWQMVLVSGPCIPLLFLPGVWASVAIIAYASTFVLFGIVLIGEYPEWNTREFWQTVLPIIVMHTLILAGVVFLDLRYEEIHHLPRILMSIVGFIVLLEWRISRLSGESWVRFA